VRAQLAFVANRGSDAPPLLLAAARRLEPIDADLARATYLETMAAAMFSGRLASPGAGLREVAREVARASSSLLGRRAPDLLLDGLAKYFTEGHAAAAPILRDAVAGLGSGMTADEELRSLWVACIAALHAWDDAGWNSLSDPFVQLARQRFAAGTSARPRHAGSPAPVCGRVHRRGVADRRASGGRRGVGGHGKGQPRPQSAARGMLTGPARRE
jgi:hypothetical protein